VRSAGGARFDRWGRSSWAGGCNTKINHHVCLKIIKLLSSPGIRATHDGLLRAPLTTVVARGRESGGGEDDLEPPTVAAWATAVAPAVVVRRDHHRIIVHRTPVCAHPTTFHCLLPPLLIGGSPNQNGDQYIPIPKRGSPNRFGDCSVTNQNRFGVCSNLGL
jgi:hypothetical protein